MPDPTPAPAPAPAPAPTPAPAPAPAWHGLAEPEAASYVENKGWKTPADVIKSYQGAEKLIGRDPSQLLVVPRADDPAGFRAVMTKLGLPESPDKYEFDAPQGTKLDDGYVAWARQTFHALGLPAPTVKALTAEHNKYIAGVLAQQEKDYNISVETDKKALLGEWKGGYERMVNAAQTAAKAIGFTTEMIDSMERAIGYAGTMKFFAGLGQKLGEDGFVTPGGESKGFGATMTPAEARAEWEKMKLDPNIQAALKDKMHPGNAEAQKKQSALFKVMYPEG